MPEGKKNPLLYLFSNTWQYSKDNKKNVIWCWIMFMIAETVDLFFLPFVFARIIQIVVDDLAKNGLTTSSLKSIEVLLGLILVRTIFVWALHGPARLLEQTNAFKLRKNYRSFLLKGLLNLPLEWHVDHHSGDTIDKINKGTNALHDFSEDSFVVIYGFVNLLGCYGMLIYLSHSSALIVLGMMLVSILITMHFDKILLVKYRQLNKTENQISESIFDAVSNISTVIILRVEKLVFEAIMKKVGEPLELTRQTNRLCEIKWFLTSCCCNLTIALVLWVYFSKNIGMKSGALAGSTFLLISYLRQTSNLFFQFCSMYGEIVKRKTRVMNAEELSKDFTTESFTNHVLPTDWQELTVSNLSFSYHENGNGDLNLEDVSLSIKKGERIAFIGERGSGKTTFLKLMRGLYKPRELTLLVDGKEISNGFDGIHGAITLVQQDPELFAQTIEKNITMGAEYEREFVRRFTDMACFSSVVDGFPEKEGETDKFQYSIKEKGINLSGGQKQCLALSRGLLACHGKDIVLLDEPTSSLDTITSITVYQNIFREFRNKTIFSTVHQLDLLPLFDRICVFDKGKIVAVGTLTELLATSGEFISLWQAMKVATIEKICVN